MPETLLYLISVCRRFQYIATLSLRIHHKWIRKRREVYYEREMRLFARNERKVQFPFDKLLKNCKNLSEFNTTAFHRVRWNPSRIPKILDLERLTMIGWCNVKISKLVVARCPKLKSLEIGTLKMTKKYRDYVIDLSCVKSNLIILKLVGLHFTTRNILDFMLNKGSTIETFFYSSYVTSAVADCDRDFFTRLIQIVYETCSSLKELELRFVQQNYFGSSLVLKPLSSLERLVIMTDQRTFSVDMLEVVLQNSPTLKDVFVVSDHIREEDMIRLCRKYCPAIRTSKLVPFNWDRVIDSYLQKS